MYIGPKLRTERPRKTKIGTEVVHVTRDSDTTFKVKVRGGQRHIVAAPTQLVIMYSVTPDTFRHNILRQ